MPLLKQEFRRVSAARAVFIFLLLSLSYSAKPQNMPYLLKTKGKITLGLGLGMSYYMGDLQPDIDFKELGLDPTVSLSVSYRLSEHFSAESRLRLYQVKGDYSPVNNLSFFATNPDLLVGLRGDLLKFSSSPIVNPYLLGGFGVTFITPMATLNDQNYSLAPLRTENVKYSRLPFFLTAGAGVLVRLNPYWSLGLEATSNFLFSDYLDDVSTVYPNFDLLPSDLARQLSDRTPDHSRLPGNQRGNSGQNDAYGIFTFSLHYTIVSRQVRNENKVLKCSYYY